ncbi:acyl transferase/acyl hydrolase/lysophospholipase [Lipomyces starkeyi]
MKTLDVSHAFHSFYMDDMLPVVETLQFNPPRLTVVSSLTGRLAEAGQLEPPDYWVQQARRAVRFSDGIQTLYHQQGVNMFLELGPQPVLLGMAAACLAADQQQDNNNELPAFLPSLTTGKRDDISVVQRTLAELHFKPFSCQRVVLPTYAFQRERFNWLNPSRVMNAGLNNHAAITNHQNGLHLGGSSDRFQFEVDWHRVDRDKAILASDVHATSPAGHNRPHELPPPGPVFG